HGPEEREDVDGERPAELLVADLAEVVDRGLGAVVEDEHVQPAEVADGVLDDLAAVPFLGHVAAERDAAAPGGLDEAGGTPGVVVLLQVGDRDIGALLRERDGGGAPDAGVAAGDEGAAALQEAAAGVVAHLVAGFGGHVAGAAGVPLALCGSLAHGTRVPPAGRNKRSPIVTWERPASPASDGGAGEA